MPELKLGKKEPTYDARDLQFADYLHGGVTAVSSLTAPRAFGHDRAVHDWGMLGNGPDDSVRPGFGGAGDCVFAGAGHETMLFTAEHDVNPARITGKESIADYSAATGYRDGDPSTDNGTVVRDGLKYRQKIGIADAVGQRHKIAAYAAIEPGHWEHFLTAIYLFGVVGIGIQFPNSAMDQFNANQSWSVVSGAQIEGGHYVSCVARRGSTRLVTWGREIGMTKGFFTKYCDEAWAILSPEHLDPTSGKSPEGFDAAQLQSDLTSVS